jgi:hypothetical protein
MKLRDMLTCLLTVVSLAQAASKPNIVFILADDFGWADTGYNPGAVPYLTPEIDKMVGSGLTLNRFYPGAASDIMLNPEPPLTSRQAKRICRSHPDRDATVALAHTLYATMDTLLQQTPHELYAKGSSYQEELYKVTGPDNVLSYGLPCIAQIFEIIHQYVAAQ